MRRAGDIQSAMDGGAAGFLVTSSLSLQELVATVRATLSGS